MKLIKVTQSARVTPGGETQERWINAGQVQYLTPEPTGGTTIQFPEFYLPVEETVEELAALLSEDHPCCGS